MENVNKRRRVFLLALSKLESGHQEINFREIRRKKIRRIHFKSDRLLPSPLSMLKLPNWKNKGKTERNYMSKRFGIR